MRTRRGENGATAARRGVRTTARDDDDDSETMAWR